MFENVNRNVSDENVASFFRAVIINGTMWAAHMCRIAVDVVMHKRGTETDSGRQRWRHVTPKRCYRFQYYVVSQLGVPHSGCTPPLQLLMLSRGFHSSIPRVCIISGNVWENFKSQIVSIFTISLINIDGIVTQK